MSEVTFEIPSISYRLQTISTISFTSTVPENYILTWYVWYFQETSPEPSLSYILKAQRSFSSGLPDSAMLVANMNSCNKKRWNLQKNWPGWNGGHFTLVSQLSVSELQEGIDLTHREKLSRMWNCNDKITLKSISPLLSESNLLNELIRDSFCQWANLAKIWSTKVLAFAPERTALYISIILSFVIVPLGLSSMKPLRVKNH